MNFELGGTGETSETGGTSETSGTGGTSETSGTGGTGGEVYTKEIAKCVYKQLDKPTDVEETLKKLAEKRIIINLQNNL